MNKFLKIAAILYSIYALLLGCTPEIQEFIDPRPIATPGENIRTTAFTATWLPLLGANSYLLEVATDGSFEEEFLVTESPVEVRDTAYVVSNLEVANTYYYRLVANLSTGEQTQYSDIITVNTLGMPAPVATVATEISTNQFTSRWQKVTEARTYEVEISSDINFTETDSLQRVVTEDTFAIIKNGLKVDEDYFYRVTARNGDIISGYSNVVHLTTTQLTKPVLLEIPDRVQNELTFQWQAVTSAINYTVEVTTDPLFLNETAYVVENERTEDTSFTVTGLNPNTSYYFRVRAHSEKSFSEYSEKGVITTSPLSTPTLNEISNLSSTSFTATWTSVSNIDSYVLEVSTYPDFSTLFVSVDEITDTTYNVEELTGDQTYYCRVKAEKDGSYSAYSNVMSQYLSALESPSNILVTNVSYTSFNIVWDVVPDASYYTVDVATDERFTSILSDFEETSVNSTSISVDDLSASTRYYFRIKAFNSYTSSAYSETSTTTTTSVPTPVAQQPSDVEPYEIYARWALVSSANSYLLDVATDVNFTEFVPGYEDLSVAGTSLIVDELDVSTTYYYRVRAIIDSNLSEYSNTVVVTTDDIPIFEIPGTIEAEDFFQNLGTARVESANASRGYYLGNITKDDSVVYRINVPSAGPYTLDFRASNNSGSDTNITVRHENNPNPSLVSIPNGSDWNEWEDSSTTLNLSAGTQVIWLKFSGGSSELMRIDQIEIE
ncbi:fibronectin type III domain-containing protein [Tunicatimonas pelagia]|uniref:fibronectin type III domain-containing protein n=1 Tax=Tunicatimonas pelagia TaxID=931531 RepID=UPI0026657FCE|nr:fibronectin type III domain-containing protein [Tunicatimonas pelagia]WKN45585.1 fibronectin type III domain-containing protein [Tunicatimonas pelagia]